MEEAFPRSVSDDCAEGCGDEKDGVVDVGAYFGWRNVEVQRVCILKEASSRHFSPNERVLLSVLYLNGCAPGTDFRLPF